MASNLASIISIGMSPIWEMGRLVLGLTATVLYWLPMDSGLTLKFGTVGNELSLTIDLVRRALISGKLPSSILGSTLMLLIRPSWLSCDSASGCSMPSGGVPISGWLSHVGDTGLSGSCSTSLSPITDGTVPELVLLGAAPSSLVQFWGSPFVVLD